MNRILLALLLSLAVRTAQARRAPNPAPSIADIQAEAAHADKPLVKDGMVIRTIQQDAELKDWLQGIMRLSDENAAEAKAAQNSQAAAAAALGAAQQQVDEKQKEVDQEVKERDNALAAKAKLQHQNAIMSTVIAAEAAVAALFVCLWLKVPELDMPWGIVVTFGAPAVVFGAVKLFLRFIL
jgi:hypothetical protein